MTWEPLEHVRIRAAFLTLAGGEVWERVEAVAWQRRERERAESLEKQRDFRSRQAGRLYHRHSERARRARGKERLERVRACKHCGQMFALTATQRADLKKHHKHAGRFCSRSCFGRFNRARHAPRPPRLVTIGTTTKPLPAWAAHFGLSVSYVYQRMRQGMSDVEALTTPPKRRPRERKSA